MAWCIEGDDATLVNDGHPAAKPVGFLHVVGGQEDGDTLASQIDDDGADVAGHVGIQAARWLIEEEHLGLMEQRRAMSRRCRIPLEYVLAASCALSVKPTWSNTCSTRLLSTR